MHEKHGREHIHVVWSRIDREKMRSVSDSHNYRKHEEVSRELERRFGHDRVQGAHHEREGVERPDRTPSRAELRQEERTGISGKQVRAEVTAAFKASDNAEAFKAALEDRGYLLAQGDRRDFVIVDQAGGIHSLARRIEGMKAAELREFMADIDRDALPRISVAKAIAEEMEKTGKKKKGQEYGEDQGYVSQSQAALADQQVRDKRNQQDFEERKVAERLKSLKERFESGEKDIAGRAGKDTEPDRQQEAPGGGHTRSQ